MIVPLVKITMCGLTADKEAMLEDLQDLGCLHVIPLRPDEKDGAPGGGPSPRARESLKFLTSCPQKRRQVKDPSGFDAAFIEGKAHQLRARIQELDDERDFLHERIEDLKPWGDFVLPPGEDLQHLRLWFYIVSRDHMPEVAATDLIWEVVHLGNRFAYVAVISEDEPEGMPVPRTRTGSKSRSELEQRLDEVELELEDLQAERVALTRWCFLFAQSLGRLEDNAARAAAAADTYDEDPLFALQAWTPRESLDRLRAYAGSAGLMLQVEELEPEETPPTLLRNRPAVSSAQTLVSFYMLPSYWLWDPSTSVFLSFAVFFAIILSDAGYSLVMGLGLAWGWKRLGRSATGRQFRVLLAALIGASVVWGALLGSYFGVEPHAGHPLALLKIFDIKDFSTMMRLSIILGAIHLAAANLANAWNSRRSAAALASIGWVLIFLGGLCAWLAGPVAGWKAAGSSAMGLGGLAVLLFTAREGPLWKRLLGGLQAFTRLSGAFGDTLSYIRLFALGLASASLAVTFNDLAGQVAAAVPGIGVLFAILIAILGHGINFLLGVCAGVIHGLRLNFIEFFNWSIPQEGYAFEAFARKEKSSWTASSP